LTGNTEAWARRLRLLPVLLLVAVALQQVALVHMRDLSAWSGGGFGMFSTTDAGAARHLHAFQVRPGVVREVEPTKSLEHLVRSTLTLPTDENLEKLAQALADVPSPDHGPPSAVRLQVWSAHFEPETLAPASRLLRGLDVSIEPE